MNAYDRLGWTGHHCKGGKPEGVGKKGDCATRALAHIYAWTENRSHPTSADYLEVERWAQEDNVKRRRDGSYQFTYAQIAEHVWQLSEHMPSGCVFFQMSGEPTLAAAFRRLEPLLFSAPYVIVCTPSHIFPVFCGQVCDGSYANARLLGMWIWNS